MKTQASDASVADFLNGVADAKKRADCWAVVEIMREVTIAEPRMWGPAIVGFGQYRYVYPDGREMDWMVVGFSPRAQNITLYLGGYDRYPELMASLGKHSYKGTCLHIKRMSDVDVPTLKSLIRAVANARTANAIGTMQSGPGSAQ